MGDKLLFDRMDANADSAVWDDEELIRMYDNATAMTHEKLQRKNKHNKGKSSNQDSSSTKNIDGKSWKVGDTCMAMYKEDGKCYSGKILSADLIRDKYEVLYTEYNEKAVLASDELFRATSLLEKVDKRSNFGGLSSDMAIHSSRSGKSLGESWRSSTSTFTTSWKTSTVMNKSWHTSATWHNLSDTNEDVPSNSNLSESELQQQNTWKKYRITTVDYMESAERAAQTDSSEKMNEMPSARYHFDMLNEVSNNSLTDARQAIPQDENTLNSITSWVSKDDRQKKSRAEKLLKRSHERKHSESPQPDRKRLKTYSPPSLINTSPPLSMDLDDVFDLLQPNPTANDKLCEVPTSTKGGSIEKIPDSKKTCFKPMSYSGYDDYALYDPVMRPTTNCLKFKTFKEMLEENQLTPINRRKATGKIKNNVFNGNESGFPSSSLIPPKYSTNAIQRVGHSSSALLKKYMAENQLRPVAMTEVFNFEATNILQKVAHYCIGLLNRAEKDHTLLKFDSVVLKKTTKTIQESIKLISGTMSSSMMSSSAIKMLENGTSSLSLYYDAIHEKLRQLPGSGININEINLSEDEVEWTDEDKTGDDEASVSIINNEKQETFPIPDLCPPPPGVFGKIVQAGSNKEALTNMLMSWYMSGYHTGFYQGLQQGKNGSTSAKRSNR